MKKQYYLKDWEDVRHEPFFNQETYDSLIMCITKLRFPKEGLAQTNPEYFREEEE